MPFGAVTGKSPHQINDQSEGRKECDQQQPERLGRRVIMMCGHIDKGNKRDNIQNNQNGNRQPLQKNRKNGSKCSLKD